MPYFLHCPPSSEHFLSSPKAAPSQLSITQSKTIEYEFYIVIDKLVAIDALVEHERSTDQFA